MKPVDRIHNELIMRDGLDGRIQKLTEEMAELGLAIIRYRSNRGTGDEIAHEIADVEWCLESVKRALKIEDTVNERAAVIKAAMERVTDHVPTGDLF